MSTPDIINGTLELCGGLMQAFNVRRLLRDKMVRGVSWPFTAFFAGWGVWNCYYYPSLGQWFSFAGGTVIVFANAIWVALAIHYTHKEKTKQQIIQQAMLDIVNANLENWVPPKWALPWFQAKP